MHVNICDECNYKGTLTFEQLLVPVLGLASFGRIVLLGVVRTPPMRSGRRGQLRRVVGVVRRVRYPRAREDQWRRSHGGHHMGADVVAPGPCIVRHGSATTTHPVVLAGHAGMVQFGQNKARVGK